MSTGMVPVTPSTLVMHESRGLAKTSGEIGERRLRLERLADDDPSGCRFAVCIDHPEWVVTPNGRSRQECEIAWRGSDESAAKAAYATYCTLLGGKPPADYVPKAADPAKRVADVERNLVELESALTRALARLDELLEAGGATKKK